MATRKSIVSKARKKTAQFQVSAALLEELGERLVSKPEVALAELIKNAYDADSAECRLTIASSKIIIADLGHGMSEDIFLNNWMVISTQAKGEQRFSRTYGRSMAGSKGVGRFSARFLGNAVDLDTVGWDQKLSKKTRIKATFDWKQIARSRSIQAVAIDYTVESVPSEIPTGTTLTIRDLRTDASRISTSKVKTDVLRLTDPSSGLERPPFKWRRQDADRGDVVDPGFKVIVATASTEKDDELSGDVAASILKGYVGRVRLEVSEEGRVSYKVFWRGREKAIESRSFALSKVARPYRASNLYKEAEGKEADGRGLPKMLENIQHLPLASGMMSPTFIDIRFFPRRAGTFSGLPVDGKRAQGWISSKSGVAVVDNNFAMANYADADSDWLAIDANKANNERRWQSIFSDILHPMDDRDRADPARNPMLALPRMRQLVGRVYVATRRPKGGEQFISDDWLQPNMDRESLRDNGAFNLLWHLTRFAVELLAVHDRNLRLKEMQEEEARKRDDARTALESAIVEVQSATDIQPDFRERISAKLRSAEKHFAEAETYSRDSRVSLELMSMMGVMAGFMTHEFEKAMIGLQSAVANIRKLSKLSPELRLAADQVGQAEGSLGEFLEYVRIFVQGARNPAPRDFKVKAQVDFVLQTLASIAHTHQVEVDVDIRADLRGPFVPVAAYQGIVVNLVSNALKAMVGKVSSADRKVRIYATNESDRHVLVVADTGIGVPEFMRPRIWDPLFTTTDDPEDNPLGTGLGLGLTVVRRVVGELKGRIELMGEAPPGFATAFRVVLPLNRGE